jgi:hypothetical protein
MTARPRLLLSLAAGLFLILLLVLVVSRRGSGTSSTSPLWTFEVELRAASGTFAQLFWTSDIDFVEEQSTSMPIQAGGRGQTLRFTMPRGVRRLRLDPTDAAGEVVIGRMSLRDADGRVLAMFATEDLTSPHDVGSITRKGSETLLVATGNDSSVLLSIGRLGPQFDTAGWSRFTAGSLVVTILAVLALLTACVWALGLDLSRAARDGTLPGSGRWGWIWLPVVFLLVFAAKLLLMRAFPVTAPYADQWDGEARGLYVPYYNGDLSWSQMFGFHNEHRIFFSRLLALALLVVNGQWDPRLQQVVNAGIHSLIAVLLLAIMWRGAEWRRLDLLALIVVPVFVLPYAWENTLLGFQSAFYLSALFLLPGLWLTTAFRAGSPAWWLGWLCALCGLFTTAGGVLLPPIIAAVAVLKTMHAPRRWWELAVTLAVAVSVIALGVLTASPPLAHHQAFKATTLGMFFSALLRNLAWPWVDYPAAGIVMWLPAAALLGLVLIRWRRTTPFERFVIGLASLVLAQAATIAYGRGGSALVPLARYQDFLSLGFVANTMILTMIVRQMPARPRWRGLAALVLIGWSTAALAGLDTLTTSAIKTLNLWRPHWEAQAANLRQYVITGDVQELKTRPPLDLPYYSADGLVDALQQPILRRLLPAAVRQPMRVQPGTVANDGFVRDGAFPTTPSDPLRPAWGTYTARGNPSQGDFESQRLPPCERGRHLNVPVAGYLGVAGLRLAVRDVTTGETHEIKPDDLVREEWANVTVPCPKGSFVMVGVDRRPDYWFAFREPVETGWASVWAERLIEGSFRLMLGALALVVVAVKLT